VSGLSAVLDTYEPVSDAERRDIDRMRRLLIEGDTWSRSLPLHVTGSAIVLDLESGRVLLRWHQRMRGWLQVGGHADPGETDPFAIALREAGEETGLPDLAAWPDPERPLVVQIAIVPVPAGRGEPAHEHADVRYVLATHQPAAAVPEKPAAQLRWLSLDEALAEVGEDNLRKCLVRIAALRQALS
jgi:8-oxo-dGTP pyrophosphatase MutT (NUDIX family)